MLGLEWKEGYRWNGGCVLSREMGARNRGLRSSAGAQISAGFAGYLRTSVS